MNAHLLDSILKYISKDENKTQIYTAHGLKRELLNDLNEDEINYLIREIYVKNSDACRIESIESRPVIYASGLTEGFLNSGGFTKIENDRKEEVIKIEEREKLEADLAKSNLKANKLNKKNAKQNEKTEKRNRITTWINIIIGFLNIALLIWQILKD